VRGGWGASQLFKLFFSWKKKSSHDICRSGRGWNIKKKKKKVDSVVGVGGPKGAKNSKIGGDKSFLLTNNKKTPFHKI